MDRSLRLQIIFNALDKLSGPIRGISGEARKLTGSMRDTNGEIRKLERTQKAVEQFRQLKTQTVQTGKELQRAKEKAEGLGRELSQTEKPSKQLTAQFQAARREVEKLEKRLDSQNKGLSETRKNLSDAGIGTRNLAQHQRELTEQVKQANDRLSDQKKRLQQLGDGRRRAEKLQALGGAVSGAGVRASVGVTAPLTALGATAFQAATDAAELESAFEVTFGKASATMKKWTEETGNRLERSTQEMMAMSMAYQDILKKQMDPGAAVEMSKKLTVLTQDLASFKNLSNDVAQQKIFSGLIGEAEPLRAVGVLLSDQAVKAKAAAMGLKKTKGEYSEGAKVQARAALIMEQLADAQGDILRTQDSTANRLKASGAAWEELKVKLGDRLLPKLTPIIDQITRLLELFGSLPPGMQQFIIWAMIIAAAVGPALIAIGGLISVLGVLSGVAATIGIGLAPLLAIIVAVGAVVAGAAYLIYNNWDWLSSSFMQLIQPIVDALGPRLSGVGSTVSAAFSKIMEVGRKLGEMLLVLWNGPMGAKIRSVLGLIGNLAAIVATMIGGVVITIINTLGSVVSSVFGIIGGVIDVIVGLLTGDFARAWEGIKAIASNAINGLVAILRGAVDILADVGRAIIDGLAAGIRSGFEWVKATVSELAGILPDWIKRPLGIHSPSRVFMQLGDAIPQGLAAGIDRSKSGPLSAVGKLAAGLAGAAAISFSPAHAGPMLSSSSAQAAAKGGGAASGGLSAGGVHIGKIEIQQLPGEDSEALVKRIVDEIERRAAAARRGSYYDHE